MPPFFIARDSAIDPIGSTAQTVQRRPSRSRKRGETSRVTFFNVWTSAHFPTTVTRFESAIQLFPGAAVPETEAHFSLHHYAYLRPGSPSRCDRSHPRYFRDDRF